MHGGRRRSRRATDRLRHVENREGAALAVRHLHDIGHERIATITGTLATRPGADRLDGYRDELSALGLEPGEEYVVEGDYYDESGYRGTQRLSSSTSRRPRSSPPAT